MRVCTHCHLLLADSASTCPYDGKAALPAEAPGVPAELHAKFTDLQGFAQGKTGTCYRATQTQSGYRGVLKIIPLAAMDAAERVRLKRELRKQTRLTHQGLARILDGGEVGETLWLFREFIEGESLAQRLGRDGSVSLGHALAIVAQLASALDELQRSGLLHRDIKPGHVLLQPSSPNVAPIVKVIDAGIAARLPTSAVFGLHGTPAYISPEQVAGKLISFRSDLYALGCVLFEMLSGRPPFVDDDVSAVLQAHKSAPPPALEMELPSAVQTLLRAMLAKEPRQRPFSAQQVRRTLEPFLPAGTQLPALSARIAGAVPAPAGAVSSQVPRPPRKSIPQTPEFGRDEITQEIDLNQIDAPPAVPHATMAISEEDLRELEVAESEAQRNSTLAISVADLDAWRVEEETDGAATVVMPAPTEASAEQPLLHASEQAPALHPRSEPPPSMRSEPPPHFSEPPPPMRSEPPPRFSAPPPAARSESPPARPAVDFDVESLFGDAVPADPVPVAQATPRTREDDAPTTLHRAMAELPKRRIEADPEGTVLVARPGMQRKPFPWMWVGAAALTIGVLVVFLWTGDDEQQPPASSSLPPAHPSEVSAAAATNTAQPPAAEPPSAVKPEPIPSQPAQNDAPATGGATPDESAAARTTEPATARGSRAERLEKAEAFKAQARTHFQARRYKEAASAYERATEQNPSDAGAFAGLGASRLAAGDAKSAVDAYSRAVRLDSKSSGFHAALGRAYLQQGDRDRARAAYERALRLNPENAAAKTALSQLK